ncbi:hypothetical protein Bca4012_033957 [Brassica carinata]|uniref:J domain-containing protein n=4 Tax=Brassica TaxID=3705 RepID=A0ABQ8A2W2_BRANA|nr:PREDICTED: uncharacterized protein LOC106337087 [Brassica oleracea var. oleracea]XP_013744665.1 uncharacterized protein LOC106447314 [Brassica napus]KAG2285570.1 hypothetical protein Bca52824_045174 [Brassica carinata]KAH0886842.1 hypothetical protein HID58_062938 [Brassica napus]VDD14979.1 unnamed protein product [Brassica oleracea]
MASPEPDPDTVNEATHHKTLAESSFTSGDLTSALNHARKALILSPNTEGVSSMVTAFETIISASGDAPEWYKILKVDPFSHMNAIKPQYRKLALVLHPDKNPYAGCEEGFRLVNEAFKVLEDRVRRSEYDMKLRVRIQGEIATCGETSTFSAVCTSKIITYSRKRKKRVGEGSESLRGVRVEEAEALDATKSLDEGMMTLAEMQSVLKRNKQKNIITEAKMGRETQEISSGDETLMEMSTNKENGKREALKNKKKKKKKTNHKELGEIVEDEDSELYDFDKEKMPRSFKKGQVWAVYDDNVPRCYCLVNEVVSVNPFKVWISWLDYESEKLISWMKNSSCGRFRVSEKALIEHVKLFSHVVNCERVAREVYQVYPMKGSVWAVYSETDTGQKRRKTKHYEVVVCLTMYSDAYGLSVAYLEKVNDDLFKRRDYGCNAVRWVEKEDVAGLLSHQIPAKKLQEDQCGAGVRESWVLDLASVPPDLVSAT